MSFKKEYVTQKIVDILENLEIHGMDDCANYDPDDIIAKVSQVSRDWQEMAQIGRRGATIFVMDGETSNWETKGGFVSEPYQQKFTLDIYGIFQSPTQSKSTNTNFFMEAIMRAIENYLTQTGINQVITWRVVSAGNGEDVFSRYEFSIPAGTTCRVTYEFTILFR